MEMFKQIGAFYLYDNQLKGSKGDYLILHNRVKRQLPTKVNETIEWVDTGDYHWDLPYDFSQAFNQIYNLEKDELLNEKSIELIERACARADFKFIKLEEPLLFIKVGTTHMPNYNAYHIYYNETKNKESLDGFEIASKWCVGESQYSTYRIYEYCNQHLIKN